MRIQSPLPQKAYLSAMREQMEGHFEFGKERFTGFFLGNVFSVTYHSGYEWNRRISNQKNSALGYVRRTENGCEARFIRLKGILCPPQFLFIACVLTLALLAGALGSGLLHWGVVLLCFAIGFAVTAITAPISALFESFTEQSEIGARVLTAFLMDPADPFSYLNNKNKLP